MLCDVDNQYCCKEEILLEPDKEGRRVVRERIMKWKHEEDHYYSSEERKGK